MLINHKTSKLMNSQFYFAVVSKNISILREEGTELLDGDYFCPLCKKAFVQKEVKSHLTQEDVPQASLGGRRITLTCRNCNSRCGSGIDIYLLNAIKAKEQKAFLPGTDRQVVLTDGEKKIKANLTVGNGRDMNLQVKIAHENPKFWEYFRDNILLLDVIIDIKDLPLKRDLRRISAAILKNAYLILFAQTEYTFLFDSYYDRLREQIINPEPFFLPERLWTMQEIPLSDGIYLTTDNRYRGFFVVYSLRLHRAYKVCVLIPTPKVEYLAACMELRKITSQNPISVKCLPQLDYLQDKGAILRLKDWCYGWQVDL